MIRLNLGLIGIDMLRVQLTEAGVGGGNWYGTVRTLATTREYTH